MFAHIFRYLRTIFVAAVLVIGVRQACGQTVQAQSETVLFSEPRFPVADASAVSEQALRQGFSDARWVGAGQLSEALAAAETKLLVLPYGSSYPEEAWPAILRYLDRGGNLIVLGGKPFTRAAYREGGAWRLRQASIAASFELYIADYQATPGSQAPGSQALRFEPNPDVQPQLPAFAWKQAFSPVIRLSVTTLPGHEIGTEGSEDAFLTTLAWGAQGRHRLAAPAFLIDHTQQRFVGGRWIFLACEQEAKAFDDPQLLAKLQGLALRRNDRFKLTPRVPLFLPGEALEFRLQQVGTNVMQAGDVLKIRVSAEDGAQDGNAQARKAQSFDFPAQALQKIALPQSAAEGRGLHTVEATLWRQGAPLWTYRSGFWMRDLEYLRSGPKLTVGADYFALDGKPLPVVGTSYMSSDANRLFLARPNVYVWDQDMQQISAAGLNMIRTGLWTGWNLLVNPDDSVNEDALRAFEAYLMTARHNHLPLQFNLFAFVPDAFGGSHAYLDPVALKAQDRFVSSLVSRFHDVPFLAWDLINEPTANANLWKTLPQHDPFEDAAWRSWIDRRYPDKAALLAAWAEPSFGLGRAIGSHPTQVPPEVAAEDVFALPESGAFDVEAVREGYNPLRVYDYFLFSQSIFKDWVHRQRETIRAAGSDQLVTIGQDEGGNVGRISPMFFSPELSFTTTHTWWDFDSVLWAVLSAKMPGEAVLVQEMGEQRRLTQDGHLRFSAEEESLQLERKMAIAFAQGAGGIEWAWTVNATMTDGNEVTIGATRPDGTEKPEARVLEGYARFARQSPASFTGIEPPAVTMVTSQALLFAGTWDLAVTTQKKAVRALAYYDHTPARMLPENRLAELGQPKLVILPAPQALSEAAWQQLMAYVQRGGCLLVSGPVEYDEHWQKVDRLTALQLDAKIFPMAVRQSTLMLPGSDHALQLTFPAVAQQSPVDTMRFADGASVKVVAHGAGKILWAADPVEFSEDMSTLAALYAYARGVAGVAPSFRELAPLSPGVLAFPTVMKDAILYSFSSECLDDQGVDIEDAATRASIRFVLGAQHGAMVLLRRSDGAVLASYGAGKP